MSWPSSSTVSEVMMRRRVFVVASNSQMFQVGWSSSSAPSMNWARIANTTLLPSKFTSRSRMSPRPSVWLAVMLISGAETEARSRMNRSAPISKRRSVRASSTMSSVFRIGDRTLHVEHGEVERDRVLVLAAADRDVGAVAAAAAGREHAACGSDHERDSAANRACGCDFHRATFRLITHCVLQNTVGCMIDATYCGGR